MTVEQNRFWEATLREYAFGDYDGVTVVLHGEENQARYFGDASAQRAFGIIAEMVALDAIDKLQTGEARFLEDEE